MLRLRTTFRISAYLSSLPLLHERVRHLHRVPRILAQTRYVTRAAGYYSSQIPSLVRGVKIDSSQDLVLHLEYVDKRVVLRVLPVTTLIDFKS